MQKKYKVSAPLMWSFLFFSLAVSVATRQLIWLMLVVGLWVLATNRRAFTEVKGVRQLAVLFACFAVPGLISLIFSYDLDRSSSAVFRFATYPIAAWLLLSMRLEGGDVKRLMSWVGILLVAWAFDGFVQLLTGVSLLGDPLIELGEEGALITGSLQLGYGATLAILSPFFLESLRRAGGIGVGILSLPVYAAIVMSGHQSSAVLALFGLAGWAMITLRNKEVGAKRQISGFVISGVLGILLGGYLSIVTGQVSTWAEAPPRYQSFLYQSQLWDLSWQAFKDNWFAGVGMRGFGTFALTYGDAAIPGLVKTWHSHFTLLEVMSETGMVGLAGYLLLLRWLWGFIQDERLSVAVAGLAALLAVFPFGTAVAMYSYIGGNLIFLTFSLLIVLDRDVPRAHATEVL